MILYFFKRRVRINIITTTTTNYNNVIVSIVTIIIITNTTITIDIHSRKRSTHLNVELVRLGVTLHEVVERPFDGVDHFTLQTCLLVGISANQHADDEHRGAVGHRQHRLDARRSYTQTPHAHTTTEVQLR